MPQFSERQFLQMLLNKVAQKKKYFGCASVVFQLAVAGF